MVGWALVLLSGHVFVRLMIYGDRNRTVEEELSGNSKFFGLPLRQTEFNSFIWEGFFVEVDGLVFLEINGNWITRIVFYS